MENPFSDRDKRGSFQSFDFWLLSGDMVEKIYATNRYMEKIKHDYQ